MIKAIKNVRLIDPVNNVDRECSIIIRDGKIDRIEDPDYRFEDACINEEEIIDGCGMIAAPGLVDVHVHFRDPGQTHKEDIHTGALAAAAGGYTSVVMMANTVPAIDCSEVLQDVLSRGAKESIRIYSCVNATKGMQGQETIDYSTLKESGAVGITDDGKPILDEGILEKVCEEAARLDLPLSLHEENPEFISENGVNSGEAAKALGLKGSMPMAEISIIKRDLEIASKSTVKLNIQHISTREGVELVREAKKTNPNIHAEATPHHFSLTDEAVKEFGTFAKMNPPLRGREDMLAIREGLRDGTIDIIATDHAPHSIEEKSRPFKDAPSGIIGLETALSLAITNLYNTGVLEFSDIIRAMSANPAKLYEIEAGSLGKGAIADIVIFDPNEEYIPERFYSKSVNTPFKGMKLNGRVKYTIVAGEIVYSN